MLFNQLMNHIQNGRHFLYFIYNKNILLCITLDNITKPIRI